MIKIFFFWFHYIQASLYIFSVRLENTMHNSWINHMISNDVQHYQNGFIINTKSSSNRNAFDPNKD